MFRFLMLFTCSIFLLTVFPVFWIFGFYVLLVLGSILIYVFFQSYSPKKSILETLDVLLPILLAVFCVSISSYTHNLSTSPGLPEGSYTLSGTIVQGLKDNEYVFETNHGDMLLRKTPHMYTYGETILLNGYFSPLDRTRHGGLFVKELSIPFVLQGEFDYDMRLWTKGYIGDMYYKNSLSYTIGANLENTSLFQSLRRTIKSRIISLFENTSHQALLNGMLTGDISLMEKDQYLTFIDSNLVHLVAVSGGNIIILVVFLFYALFFLPYKVRVVCIMPCILFYTLLVGIDASVFRALIMGSLTLFALISGRFPNTKRLMMLARVLLLCIRPYSLVYDLGFLLSFFALGGIVFFQDTTKSLLGLLPSWGQSFFGEYVLSSIGASFGVLPVLLFFIGSTNIVGFIANIFVLPIVPLIMYLGIVSLLIGTTIIGPTLITIVDRLLSYIYICADFFAAHGFYITLHTPQTKFLFFGILCLVYGVGYRFILSQHKKSKTL